jgi:hypothetical protein
MTISDASIRPKEGLAIREINLEPLVLDLVSMEDLLAPQYLTTLKSNGLNELAELLESQDTENRRTSFDEDSRFHVVAEIGKAIAFRAPESRPKRLQRDAELLIRGGYLIIKDLPTGMVKDRRVINYSKAREEIKMYRELMNDAGLRILADWQTKANTGSQTGRALLYNCVAQK